MEYTTRQIGEHKVVDFHEDFQLKDERAALDIVGACVGEGTDRVLLHSANLPEDFFRLSTGLAGTVLLKFSNYFIKAAAVIPPERIHQGKFYDFSLETNRGNQFRIFHNQQDAEEWIAHD